MIKLFRNIRQRLLSESKFSKYLIYAIGEIVLVMIGILMALQINNWNTERILDKESREFTVRLLSEVRVNIKANDEEIKKEERQIKSARSILEMFHTERDMLSAGELDSLIYLIILTNEIDLSMATLTEGLNTGKIPLIPSDTLRNLLYSLPTTVDKVSDSEDVSALDINDFLFPFLFDHFNMRAMDHCFSPNREELGVSGFPEHNSLECLGYLRFENMVDNIYFNSHAQLEEYKKLKIHLEKLEKHLEQ